MFSALSIFFAAGLGLLLSVLLNWDALPFKGAYRLVLFLPYAVPGFSHITLPLILKPLTPLLISAFAFNFNNFVLISLLTGGRPDQVDTTLPAGTTDILVSYTWRIAFQDAGQQFGLASAISTVIFLIVASITLVQLRFTRLADVDKR
jgi:maltose/maltodextrin transport system permease protein